MVLVNVHKNYYTDFRNILDTLVECYSNVKDKIKSNFDIYDYFNQKLNLIADNLESIPFCEKEFDDFLEIRSYSLYIIHKYCKNPSFGHVNDIIYLLNLFKSIIEEKFNLFKDFSADNLKDYNVKFSKFNEKLYSYDEYFLSEVYESNSDYVKDVEMFSKALMDD
jgi:hypothetical protein